MAEILVLKAALNLKWVVIIALNHRHGQLFIVLSFAELPSDRTKEKGSHLAQVERVT